MATNSLINSLQKYTATCVQNIFVKNNFARWITDGTSKEDNAFRLPFRNLGHGYLHGVLTYIELDSQT